MFSPLPALLTSLVPAPSAACAFLMSCFVVPLFCLLSSCLLPFRMEYLNAGKVHPTLCLLFSCAAETLIRKCVLRQEGLGKKKQCLPWHWNWHWHWHCMPASSSRLCPFSLLPLVLFSQLLMAIEQQCEMRKELWKTSHWYSSPTDTTGGAGSEAPVSGHVWWVVLGQL